jgi:hypothetical protein
MRSWFVTLSLAASLAAAAQTRFPVPSPQHEPQVFGFNDFNVQSGCPVSLVAQQHGAPQTLWTIALEDQRDSQLVGKISHHQPVGYGVHVELATRTAIDNPIRSAELAVIYFTAGTRAIPVRAVPVKPPTGSKTFQVTATDAGTLQADLLLGQVSGIRRVYVVSLTYAESSTWLASSPLTCSVQPSPYLLVAR